MKRDRELGHRVSKPLGGGSGGRGVDEAANQTNTDSVDKTPGETEGATHLERKVPRLCNVLVGIR